MIAATYEGKMGLVVLTALLWITTITALDLSVSKPDFLPDGKKEGFSFWVDGEVGESETPSSVALASPHHSLTDDDDLVEDAIVFEDMHFQSENNAGGSLHESSDSLSTVNSLKNGAHRFSSISILPVMVQLF